MKKLWIVTLNVDNYSRNIADYIRGQEFESIEAFKEEFPGAKLHHLNDFMEDYNDAESITGEWMSYIMIKRSIL